MRVFALLFLLALLSGFFCEEKDASAQALHEGDYTAISRYQLPYPGDCSDEAIKKRKDFVLSQTASDAISRDLLAGAIKKKAGQLNGKRLIPIASAVLETHPDKKLAKDVILRAMRYRQRDNMFTKIRAAQAFYHFHESFSEEEIARFKQETVTYSGFFGYGTENHIAMKRIAGLLFGQSFPEAEFKHGLTGRQVMDECMAYMQRYGRAVYGSSNSEFLSHIYFPVHMEAWASAWQYAQEPVARLMARAVLDWFFANAALNYHHRFVNGPLCRAAYRGIEAYEKHALSRLLWVYGADTGETPEALSNLRMPSPVVSIALTDYMPHKAIRNILTKKVQLPFTIRQACANKGYVSQFCQNNLAKEKVSWKYPYQKSFFRYVYIHKNYAMGGGNLRITHEIFSSIPTTIAFTASWQSKHPYNYLLAAHPYWFTKKKWSKEESMWGFGDNIENKGEIEGTYFLDEDLFGFSPCLQMVQKENAAVLFYYIPEIDPFKNYRQKGGSASDRLKELIQECFVYIPKSVEERVQTENGFFIRDGNTYIAVIPFSPGAAWEKSVRKDFFRIGIPGELTGFAIEMGDQTEYGSFKEFISRFSRDRLDLTRLKTERLARYNSSRGHVLTIRHTGFDTGLPKSTINGTKVDFETYPTIESPYVTAEDHVLDVNDGKSGFTVDWRKEYPSYSYYHIEKEKKRVFRRIWVENGKMKEQCYDE